MSNWIKANLSSVVVQLIGVLIFGLIAITVTRQLDGYVRVEDWKARNKETDAQLVELKTSMMTELRELRHAIEGGAVFYVSQKMWETRNAIVDDRFEKLEKVVTEGRAERMAFQREALDRLARIEERLTAHTQKETKP